MEREEESREGIGTAEGRVSNDREIKAGRGRDLRMVR